LKPAIGVMNWAEAGTSVNVIGVPAAACGTSTFRIEPRCTLIWKPVLVAGASMLATGFAAATALDTGLGSAALAEVNGVGDPTPLDAAALDAGADAPELTAPDARADDDEVAVDLAAVQPARNVTEATTVPAATTAKRGPRARRAWGRRRGRRLVGVS
jgi:hypothetical protein